MSARAKAYLVILRALGLRFRPGGVRALLRYADLLDDPRATDAELRQAEAEARAGMGIK